MNLLEFLKNKPEARKIFGKRELKIIEKQLHGINLSQSEKNRLSRDIRKKLKFIKDISRFSDEFELKKGRIIKDRIDYAVRKIKEDKIFIKVKKIILFGSTTTNERTFRSDIDIAVEFENIEPKEATEFRVTILGKVNNQIDIQVYNVLPDKIKKSIDEKGKIIYERN